MSLFRFFKNPLKKKPMVRLIDYGSAQLTSLVADNPGGVHTTRITALTAAFNLLDDGMEDVETKAAIQAGKVVSKKLFRYTTVPETVSRIHAAVVMHYGVNSADMAECFPHGREVFGACKDQELDDHLGQLSTCVGTRTATLGAPITDDAADMVTTWATCIGDLGTAGGNVEMMRAARQNAKTALAHQLFLTLLHLAATYPDDAVKFNQYVPEEELEPSAPPAVPGVPEITGATGGAGQFSATATASGADIIHWLARQGAAAFVELGNGAPGEETSFDALAAGSWDIEAQGENGAGLGPVSAVVTVVVT